jgi:hypothetical protein
MICVITTWTTGFEIEEICGGKEPFSHTMLEAKSVYVKVRA